MTILRYRASNHPQQMKLRGAVDEVDDRRTPDDFWLPLHAEHAFTLDAAATADNSKLPRWCRDGLAESWRAERVWCNPPFSDCRSWVEKAWQEVTEGGCALVVMLLPANRTEQGWWQQSVEPYRDTDAGFRVHFLPGRMRFTRPGWQAPPKGDRPPFGCCLLVWQA